MASPALLAAVATLGLLAVARADGPGKYVYPGPDGKLVYWQDDKGNRIPDFSNCGYRGGGVAIPDVPVKIELSPPEGDATAAIQQAIDTVSALPPDAEGRRGAVLLKKGIFRVGNPLVIKTGGVVLRGQGSGEEGTVLLATSRTQHTLVEIGGLPADGGKEAPRELKGTRRAITDDYVPVGARTITVTDAGGFKPGDTVIVQRVSTAAWIHELGMDNIPPGSPNRKLVQWEAGSKDLNFDRVITAVRGNQIEVDAPICNAIERGTGSIYQYEMPFRIAEVGVENLRGDSLFANPTDEKHGWIFLSFNAVQNGWVRDVTSVHFGKSCVSVERPAKWITIEESACLDPISVVKGERRYSFCINGQLNLVQRCRTKQGRHDFVTNGTIPGPNAFVNCVAEEALSASGPHQRWAVGMLFDNVTVQGHNLEILNRGFKGTGHGWSGANSVMWNCTAKQIICESPPTAQNWAIGVISEEKPKGNGYWDSVGSPVSPPSLYFAQLHERLGPDAVKAVHHLANYKR